MTDPKAIEVHHHPPPPEEPPTMAEHDLRREAATMALAARPGFDLAAVDEQEFERGLERLKVRQRRMLRILDTVLVPGAHYGNPNNAWAKPRLLKPGAEELANLFRLSPRLIGEPVVIQGPEFVSVSVRIALFDSRGFYLAEKGGNCNALEKRFKKKSGAGFTWVDAREALHDCYSMAEKRAFVAVVLGATGADAFFANGEVMEKALAAEAEEAEDAAEAGTADERKQATREEVREVMFKARDRGIADREQWVAFVEKVLGRRFIAAGDLPAVRAAIEALPVKTNEAAATNGEATG